MPRVICKLHNASELINGVVFEPHPDGGMISEEIDEATAKHFVSISGYELVAEEGKPAAKTAAAKAAPEKPAAAAKASGHK